MNLYLRGKRKWKTVVDAYLRVACKKIGYLKFLNYICNENYNDIEEYVKIINFIDNDSSRTYKQVDLGLMQVKKM